MQLQFKEQQFQLDAVNAVVNCFVGQLPKENHYTLELSTALMRKTKEAALGVKTLEFDTEIQTAIGYRNAEIKISDEQLLINDQVQKDNEISESKQLERTKGVNKGYNLTIEMETGTGKTYTYIRTMYELHKKYGWSKFIIIVPSIAIREGVYKSFEITQTHFQEIYNHKIVPFIYNSSRPQDIENFASDSRISVMIINTQAFASRGADARRIYFELDQFGSRRPIEIIAQTNPIIIIDEPQSVDGEATLKSMQDFNPLLTLRYSATHKVEYNKIFRLDALDAYNKKLVKKIQVKGISLKGTTGTNGYLYLEQIILSKTKPPVALIEYEKRSVNNEPKRVRERLEKGANIFQLSGNMQQYQQYTIQEIDGYHNKIVINGQDIFAGEVVGDYYEKDFRRIQIRETILSHLTKEKQLFDKGIKVLSLFFIDSVDKYRVYDKDGNEGVGEYAKIFEEEYNKVRNDFMDMFHQEYNDFLQETDLGKVHKGYLPTNYAKYLVRDEADKIHNGYFSIDKRKKLIDPTVKRGSDDTDDISAYDLIMKDKERLLSFSEPTRFIFSHSALKEGWDNPNVFQICALKHSDATIRRRQEVGRGMRLCVNEDGIRLDYDTIGEQVHEINKLTVIASESYEAFAKGLQDEIAAALQNRPQKIEVKLFLGKVLTNEKGEQLRLNDAQANLLNNTLLYERIADINGKITDTGKTLIEQNKVPLPANLEPFRSDINKLLTSIYTGEPFGIDNDRNIKTIAINSNFYKKEFQALWEKINIKSIYEVRFDTAKLIEDSRNRINADLNIADRSYEVKEGVLEQTTKEKIENNEAITVIDRTNKKLSTDIYTNTLYDIIGEIVAITNLKRQTIADILKKISPVKFLLIRKNPEEFIAKSSKLINEVKASLIYNNIVYHKVEDTFDAKTVFTNTKEALRNAEMLKKHIYDYIITDSKIETAFAKSLDNSTEVSVYAKLPKNFYITTPVANYSPDWVIVFDKEKVRHIYFVAETKGSDSDLELREIEKLKLHCADEHFKAISNTEVVFKKVNSYEKLLEVVQLK
ncbi:type III restriction-modification system endonuclease [Segetibacter koreensis]|uniref:type III restriction-modification system endonuclease n=1 Tax=Segetibacter koreensis TaxID=398037 RepID=UPI0003667CF1|nr:DEAD/DEAH box helicase family protein [Segetibacter koreensis]